MTQTQLAQAFKQVRWERRITLDRAAQKIGISIGYLNRFEHGFVTIKNLKKLKAIERFVRKLENQP